MFPKCQQKIGEILCTLYSENHKTIEYEDDIKPTNVYLVLF